MRRILVSALAAVLLSTPTVALAEPPPGPLPAAVTPPEGGAPPDAGELDVYETEVGPGDEDALSRAGVDLHEAMAGGGDSAKPGTLAVDLVLNGQQVAELRREGLDVRLKRNEQGQSVAAAAAERAEEGFDVWRPYSGPGGIQEEMEEIAARYPGLTRLDTIGHSVQGQPIYALKVTTNPNRRDGAKPAVLYASAQHAREWITVEMNRRLLLHFLEGYGRDPQLTDLVAQNELWFVLVANPDGYDYTFTDNRIWRKNLRDNNGDGEITAGDGVDLNRNFPYRWGYDNEGSSPDPASETYRGPAPVSEPETQALDTLMAKVGFDFLVNYHSAAELLLYGAGWQVATPTPDDRIYAALAGTDENPAIPGYDPDLSAELYTTNGDTDTHAHENLGILGFTPELDTCRSATLLVDDDAWEPADCEDLTVFEFPDDERLVQLVFEKNLPFALSVAESASDPDDPVSAVGLETEPFYVDSFDVSHGSEQVVAVEAKRALRGLRMWYRIDRGRAVSVPVEAWGGGERYGDEHDLYYDEFRGTVTGAEEGDRVEVWFEGRERPRDGGRRLASEHFTYTVASASGAPVLVIADEDYTGVNPVQEDGPSALPFYTQALDDERVDYEVWDTDVDGVPHPLGVLSHYETVIWETGADRIAQDPEDEVTTVDDEALGPEPVEYPDISVAERKQYLTLAVRDFLNEGGKLLHAGENVGYFGLFGFLGGLYYGLNGAPEAECVVEQSPDQGLAEAIFGDCLIYADDFYQYWLGAYGRTTISGPAGFEGVGVLEGEGGRFGGPGLEANPLDEAGNFTVTSEVLPVEEFPQFASARAATYGAGTGPSPYGPFEGESYVGVLHDDDSYARLSRTVAVPADGGELTFQLSYDTEIAYDHVLVEVETADGTRATLPEVGGGTTTTPSAACGQYGDLHPTLLDYAGVCGAEENEGAWNSFTGNSGGWQEVAFDLTPYAGQEVTVSVSYVTDAGAGGVGAFVDAVRVPGEEVEGFESGHGAWTVAGPPEGSPEGGAAWVQGGVLFEPSAGVSTEDTVLLGFGLEQIESRLVRRRLLDRVLDELEPRSSAPRSSAPAPRRGSPAPAATLRS